MSITTSNYTGADCTKSSGDQNRVLTITNTNLTKESGFSVTASGLTLALISEYTVSHKSSDTEITFLNRLWDDMSIVVTYDVTITSSISGALSTGIVDSQIETFGELVTLIVKSSRTYSDWGDESSTETESTNIKAVYNVYGKPSDSNEEGKFQEREITFFFKSDQTGIVRGTKVTRSNGDVYSISDVRDHGTQGNTFVHEVQVKKI